MPTYQRNEDGSTNREIGVEQTSSLSKTVKENETTTELKEKILKSVVLYKPSC